jgi:hypothetical protein
MRVGRPVRVIGHVVVVGQQADRAVELFAEDVGVAGVTL